MTCHDKSNNDENRNNKGTLSPQKVGLNSLSISQKFNNFSSQKMDWFRIIVGVYLNFLYNMKLGDHVKQTGPHFILAEKKKV